MSCAAGYSNRAWLSALVFVIVWAATGSAQARTHAGPRCLSCHGELEFLRQHTASLDSARALHIDEREVHRSAHSNLECAQCHTGFAAFPHSANVTTKSCQQCHTEQNTAWQKGRHASTEGRVPVTCTQCHGVHDAARASQLRTPDGRRAMNALCASCHEEKRLSAGPHADSVACNSCHGAHDIQPMHVATSTLSLPNQDKTCGACHSEIAASWIADVHGSALLTGANTAAHEQGENTHSAPACTTCHGGHGLSVASDSTLARAGQERCAGCHEKYAETFGDSYHGQAARLEDGRAATCASCHSAHSIYPAHDARSTVASANLVATCGSCHADANAGFVRFQPHADPHDAAKNPLLFWVYKFMNLLLVGVLGVFGLHTALWVLRVSIEKMRSARAGGEA